MSLLLGDLCSSSSSAQSARHLNASDSSGAAVKRNSSALAGTACLLRRNQQFSQVGRMAAAQGGYDWNVILAPLASARPWLPPHPKRDGARCQTNAMCGLQGGTPKPWDGSESGWWRTKIAPAAISPQVCEVSSSRPRFRFPQSQFPGSCLVCVGVVQPPCRPSCMWVSGAALRKGGRQRGGRTARAPDPWQHQA
jgi:hypothetical protein